MPWPKWYCQMRLTITRVVSGLSGLPIHSASAVRRPVVCEPTESSGLSFPSTVRKPGWTVWGSEPPGMIVGEISPAKSVTVITSPSGLGLMSSNAASSFLRLSYFALSSFFMSFSGPPPSSSNWRDTR